ncbi:MAG: STAS domain-containing protein [Elainellaceae cyanobacterium]
METCLPMLKVFQPSKHITEVNAQEIREWVQESLSLGAKHLLLDFSDVQFINSSGLGTLAISLKVAREAQCDLALCQLSPQARMTLEISGMDQAFDIYSSQDDFVKTMPSAAQTKTA